jgi:hypothetical protein
MLQFSMGYWIMADGERWMHFTHSTILSRYNLSEAVKLAKQLDDLGYENVHIVGG